MDLDGSIERAMAYVERGEIQLALDSFVSDRMSGDYDGRRDAAFAMAVRGTIKDAESARRFFEGFGAGFHGRPKPAELPKAGKVTPISQERIARLKAMGY